MRSKKKMELLYAVRLKKKKDFFFPCRPAFFHLSILKKKNRKLIFKWILGNHLLNIHFLEKLHMFISRDPIHVWYHYHFKSSIELSHQYTSQNGNVIWQESGPWNFIFFITVVHPTEWLEARVFFIGDFPSKIVTASFEYPLGCFFEQLKILQSL